MPKHEDSIGPAYVLREGTDELKKFLDTSVSEICDSLKTQILDLVNERTSTHNPISQVDKFPLAKLQVFSNTSAMVIGFVDNAKEQLDDMRDAFIERVEVFLANTKLAVTLPSSSDTPAGRWSPKSRQDSSSPKKSLYSTMLNAAKNFPSPFSLSPTKQKDKKQSVRFLDDSSSSLQTPVESRSRGKSAHSTSLVQPSPILKKTPRSAITPILTTLPEQPTSSTPRPQRSQNAAPPKAGAASGKIRPKRDSAKTSTSTSSIYVDDLVDFDDDDSDDDYAVLPTSTSDASFHNVYSVGMDVNDDLDIYSDELPPKSPKVSRRKTIAAPKVADKTEARDSVSRSGKRKTMTAAETSGSPPSKRVKSGGGGRKSTGSTKLSKATSDSNLLEGERADAGKYKYTPWIALKDIDGKVPNQPGVFELKVLQAKKPAYIGSCDSLRNKFTLYKLAQKSGNNVLDKFIARNSGDVMIRYETISSLALSKTEEKNRVKAFSDVHKKMPAFN